MIAAYCSATASCSFTTCTGHPFWCTTCTAACNTNGEIIITGTGESVMRIRGGAWPRSGPSDYKEEKPRPRGVVPKGKHQWKREDRLHMPKWARK